LVHDIDNNGLNSKSTCPAITIDIIEYLLNNGYLIIDQRNEFNIAFYAVLSAFCAIFR